MSTMSGGTLREIDSVVGMGLLYYGQNFLIYPSAFLEGAQEGVIHSYV